MQQDLTFLPIFIAQDDTDGVQNQENVTKLADIF